MTFRVAVIGTGFRPAPDGRLPDEIAAIVSANFECSLVQITNGVFPADRAARDVVDEQYVEAGLQAAADGCDAVYINTVGDYGLSRLRAELPVPVVGAGETAYRTAVTFGRFAIVTIWPPALDFIQQRTLAQSGTADRCLGITCLADDSAMATLGDDENFVTEMRACSLAALAQIREARDAAIEAGAAAVVLGCTCMAPAAGPLGAHAGGVTIDPLTLGYRFTEYCLARHLLPEAADFMEFRRSLAG